MILHIFIFSWSILYDNWICTFSYICIAMLIIQVGKYLWCTNLMYVQAEDIKLHGNFSINIPKKRVKEEVCKNFRKSQNYISRIRGNRAAWPELKYVLVSDASLLRKRMFFRSFFTNAIYAPFPSYSEFCASITKPSVNHKAYFDVILLTPPNKTTVYDVMKRCRKAAEFKSIPFVQFVGDQPVYALILEIINKNPMPFEKVLLVLAGFRTACGLLSVIYRRFKGLVSRILQWQQVWLKLALVMML